MMTMGEGLKAHVSQREEALKERIAGYLDRGSVVAAAIQALFDAPAQQAPELHEFLVNARAVPNERLALDGNPSRAIAAWN